MWLTGRVSGAATVLVLDPSQVTVLPEAPDEPDVFEAEVPAADFEPPVVEPVVEPDVPAEEPVEPVDPVEPLEPVESEAPPEEDAASVDEFVEAVVAAPSSWAPVPSPHAVRASAARTVVAAAATRRVREVRNLDMSMYPFGVRVAVVTG